MQHCLYVSPCLRMGGGLKLIDCVTVRQGKLVSPCLRMGGGLKLHKFWFGRPVELVSPCLRMGGGLKRYNQFIKPFNLQLFSPVFGWGAD